MRWALAMAVVLLAMPAWAQTAETPGSALNADWIAFNVQFEHLRKALAAYTAETSRADERLKQADDRLKWVLDNWCGPPASPAEDKK